MSNDEVKVLVEKLFLNQECGDVSEEAAKQVVEYITETDTYNLVTMITSSCFIAPEISAANISQFSQFLGINEVLRVLLDSGYENISFVDMGYFLTGKKTDGAKRKYGENHYKLTVQLGMARKNEPHMATWLGKAYREVADEGRKNEIAYKLSLRVPLIQRLIREAVENEICGTDIMLEYLSNSTMIRRRSNIRKILSLLESISDEKTKKIFRNIRW